MSAVVAAVLVAGAVAAVVWWPRSDDTTEASRTGEVAAGTDELARTRYVEVKELCTEADLGSVQTRFPKREKPENMQFKFPDVQEAACFVNLVNDAGEKLFLSLETSVTGDRSARSRFEEAKAEVTGKKITVTEVTGLGESAFQYLDSELRESRTLVVLDGNMHLSVELAGESMSVEDLTTIATATLAKLRL